MRARDAIRYGFSLLEISIVILIIGLLIGGVVTASSIIKTAGLQQVIAEYNRYSSAVSEFQKKYMALPGDFDNATTLWGDRGDGACSDAMTELPTTTATCNGNATGFIGSANVGGAIGNARQEWWLSWQHLANAGMIEGKFTGSNFTADDDETDAPGFNIPRSSFKPGVWKLFGYLNNENTTGSMALEPAMWGDQYSHILSLGSEDSETTHAAPVLSPVDALELDSKIDDGFPGLGRVRTWRNNLTGHGNCNDITDDTQSGVRYNTSFEDPACVLLFMVD